MQMLCRVDWCFPAFSLSSHYGILMQDAVLSGLVFPSLLLILTLWNSYADAMLSGLVFPSLLLIIRLWNSYAGCYVEWTGVSQPSPYPHTMEFLCRCYVEWTGVSQPSPYPHTMEFLCRMLCRVDWCFPAFSLSSHYGILMQDAMLSGLVFPSLLLILTLWNSYADAMLSGLVFPSLLLILTLWNSYAGCYVEWTGVSQPSPYPHTMEFLCRMLC